ncbi:MAG: SMP-30/gluconolactonase/LRE family protein [Candidatus Anammoximicrobium sp.]|nr:SMP-30/gluconolactonase/LRE family protein [Candidatus Anammoximicrobium sp.]
MTSAKFNGRPRAGGWKPWSLLGCFLALAGPALADDELPPSHSVTPELYATGFAFAEGPTFDVQGNLYVVNYRELGTIGRITPDGAASIWCDLRKASPVEGRKVQANGLKVDSENRLIAADAGGGRVLRISPDGQQVEVLADRCDGIRFDAINDVALDRKGNLFFTDPGNSSADKPTGSVYRYDIGTKRTTRLATGLAYPNGIGVTPDQRHLCVGESDRYRLLIFDLDQAAGEVRESRVLIDFPGETKGNILGGKFAPDGFVFDESGRLFVAMWVGGVVNVVDVPSGNLLRQYNAGGPQVTNCHFHGSYLYATVAAKEAVFRLKLGRRGDPYWMPPSPATGKVGQAPAVGPD